MDCCSEPWDEVFTSRFARSLRRRYERRGLAAPARRVVDLIAAHGLTGTTVLEIGGGVGDLQVELLRRGAARATNLELSSAYEADAQALLTRYGLRDRVTRLSLDLATDPEGVAPADIVVLHRVVCCYPDDASLLTAAAGRARRLLVFSHPPPTALWRAEAALVNAWSRMVGHEYRAYVHPPEDMLRAVESAGFRQIAHRRTAFWWIWALERM